MRTPRGARGAGKGFPRGGVSERGDEGGVGRRPQIGFGWEEGVRPTRFRRGWEDKSNGRVY